MLFSAVDRRCLMEESSLCDMSRVVNAIIKALVFCVPPLIAESGIKLLLPRHREKERWKMSSQVPVASFKKDPFFP